MSTRPIIVRWLVLLTLAGGLLAACSANDAPPERAATPQSVSNQGAAEERRQDSATSVPGANAQDAQRSSDDHEASAETAEPQEQHTDPNPPEPQDDPPSEPTVEVEASPFYVPPEDVNVNAWVNSYDYDLPDAELGTALTVSTTLTPNPLIPEYHLMRVVVTVPLLADETPFNVTLVLDPGGAMADEDTAAAARLLASGILDALQPDRDRVAIVWFPEADEHPHVIGHSRTDWQPVREAIAEFGPRERVDLRRALDLAAQTADAARSEWPDSHNYVVFVSDGSLELDSHDPFAALGADGDSEALNPLRFLAYGIGLRHFEDRVLGSMAKIGNGGYSLYWKPELVAEHFDAETWRQRQIPYAEQLSVEFSINPETTLGQRVLISPEDLIATRELGEDRPDLRALPAGTWFTTFLFVELKQPPAPGQELHVGQAVLRWLTPRSRETNRQELPFVAAVTEWDQDPRFAFGGIVAMSTFLYGFFGDELVQRDGRLYAHWGLTELLRLFDQLPEDLRAVEANDRFRRYLLEMVKHANQWLLESAESDDLREGQALE